MSINKALAKAIAESKIPISRIAERSGISRQHIYKIINNEKNVSSVTLENICKAINITPSSLYNGQPEQSKGIRIPVLGVVPAGIPIEAIEEILEYEEITPEMAKSGEYFGLKVKGDSMSPNILEGDVLIVRKQEDANSGDICVVMVNGDDATVKKIKKDPKGLTLIPNNPAYDVTYFTNEEIVSIPVRIIGKVVESRRSY